MKKKLYKSEKNKMVCGVCSGIAEYFNCDPTIVRLIAVIICLFKGFGLLLYILAVIIIPSGNLADSEFNESNDDIENMKSAHINDVDEDSNEESPHSDEEFNSFFKKNK